MQNGQGYLNSLSNILHFGLPTSSQGYQGPDMDCSWRIVSSAYYSFNLVRQENSITRDQAEINISHAIFFESSL